MQSTHSQLELKGSPSHTATLSAVFNAYRQMEVGQTLELVSGEDLAPVKRHLESILEREHRWRDGHSGPGVWTALVTKLEAFQTCCGSCG